MTCVYKENEDNLKMVEEEGKGVRVCACVCVCVCVRGGGPDERMNKFLASRGDSLHPQVGKTLRLGLEFEEGG